MINYLILDIDNLCLDKESEILDDIKKAILKHKDYARIRKVTFYNETTKPEAIKQDEKNRNTILN